MTTSDDTELTHRIEALLSQERDALLSGDLRALGDLAEEKERLAACLQELGPERRAALRGLHDMASRNQALLDGALQGIRLATERLSAYRRLRKSMDTYDPQGNKTAIPGVVSRKVERRA